MNSKAFKQASFGVLAYLLALFLNLTGLSQATIHCPLALTDE